MKGKRVRGLLLLSLAAVLLLAAAGCSRETSKEKGQGEVIELRLAHFFPSTHPAEKELIEPWAEEINKATGGRVKITSYPQETLLPAAQIYDGVVDGIADIGLSCFSYTRGRFPVLEVFELPGIIYPSSDAASRVAWEGIKTLNPKEVQDTKLMMVLTTGPGDIYTKVPVRTLEDLKGLEIRATGLSAKSLQALGAVPVAMPQSESNDALAKGAVKGNLGPVEVLKGWNQAEVVDYVTRTPFLYNTLFFITMNRDKWDSLGPEMQKIIEDINEKFFEEVACRLWDKQNEEALQWAIETEGIEVITLSPEEFGKWVALITPLQEDFVESMNKQGFDGEQILRTVKELAAQYGQ